MRAARGPCLLLVTLVVWLGVLGAPRADGEAYKVIVHPSNPVTAVERAFVRDTFLKKATSWGHGPGLRPIDLGGAAPIRTRFSKEVLRKTRAQLRSYWNQQIFSGKGVPPPEATSVASAIAYVLDNPGAIAYVPADADVGRARVIRLE
jgi:hypothetical protein